MFEYTIEIDQLNIWKSQHKEEKENWAGSF